MFSAEMQSHSDPPFPSASCPNLQKKSPVSQRVESFRHQPSSSLLPVSTNITDKWSAPSPTCCGHPAWRHSTRTSNKSTPPQERPNPSATGVSSATCPQSSGHTTSPSNSLTPPSIKLLSSPAHPTSSSSSDGRKTSPALAHLSLNPSSSRRISRQ